MLCQRGGWCCTAYRETRQQQALSGGATFYQETSECPTSDRWCNVVMSLLMLRNRMKPASRAGMDEANRTEGSDAMKNVTVDPTFSVVENVASILRKMLPAEQHEKVPGLLKR